MDKLIEQFWENLWVENFKDMFHDFQENRKKEEERLKNKYPITKDDLLLFSNIFYNIRLDMFMQGYTLTQFLTQVPETVLIPYWHRNEIINDIAKDRMILFLKLTQRWFIFLYLNDYKIHIQSEKNQRIKEILEIYRKKKWDPENNIFLTQMWYWESLNESPSIWKRIKDFIFRRSNTYKLIRNGVNFYINDLLDENFESLVENLDYGIDFNFLLYDKNWYVWYSLTEISKFKSQISYWIQIEKLFQEIKEQIWNKNNHFEAITLSYPLSEYIENKNQYFIILDNLGTLEYITFKEIYIYQGNITFIIEKIHWFDESIKNKLLPIEERISFENWFLKLDWKNVLKQKKAWQKIYELIDICIIWIKKHKKTEISFEELKNIFIDNEEKYPYLLNSINTNGKYFEIKNRYKKETNEKMKINYKNELNHLLDKIFLSQYFHSTLWKWDETKYFTTKSKGILFSIES